MKLNKRFEAFVTQQFRKRNVPESLVTERVRKTGRGMLLISIMFIVPLVVFDYVPTAIKIVLQVVYAALMCAGLMLAFDDEDKRKTR